MGDPAPSDAAPPWGVGPLARVLSYPFIGAIMLYRVTLSPFLGGQCRYHPTCSIYALGAYRAHGPVRGTILTVARLARCHPFSKGGYDPVPINDRTAPSRYAGPGPSPEPPPRDT